MVDKDRLEGFRSPTETEKGKITDYFRTKISGELRPMTFWTVICGAFAGGFLLNFAANVNPGDRKEDMICLVFLCVMAVIIFNLRLSRKKKKMLLHTIIDGKYGLMECKVYEERFDISLTGEAEVRVYNEKGQYCNTFFTIDEITAKKCKENEHVCLLLLKCGDDFYELLSEQRMGVNRK